jgi:hypothetical protein
MVDLARRGKEEISRAVYITVHKLIYFLTGYWWFLLYLCTVPYWDSIMDEYT